MRSRIAVALLALLPFGGLLAGEVPAALDAVLAEVFAGEEPDAVSPAALDGFYEVVRGRNVYYFSADGRFALRGDLYDLEKGVNLSEERRAGARLELLRDLGEESMIVFSPPSMKHSVTVFTDVDCGYCARLHRQIADYNRLGISVRYVAWPRAGIPSETYDKMVSVWCADDPHQAMGDAKFGRPLTERTCDNPVSAHFLAGQKIGVQGTPAILLENGALLAGYVPPEELLSYLGEDAGGS